VIDQISQLKADRRRGAGHLVVVVHREVVDRVRVAATCGRV
jgi:hypothetical protein